MNKKIREFFEQVAYNLDPEDCMVSEEFLEAFSELIVRQCICLCDDENSQKYIAQKFGLDKELGLE